ncbi:MAG: GH3 family domain-containing protein [Phycisphaerales bacterium]
MGSWTSVVGVGLHAYLARRARALDDRAEWAASSGSIQRGQLRWLLDRAKGTAFGRRHGFERIHAISADDGMVSAYRDAVPIREYLALRDEWLEPMRTQGLADHCWPGVVRDWAQTSGTTAGDKYVPVSKDLLRHNFRCALDIYAHSLRRGISLPKLFGGKIMFLGGSTDLSENEAGVRTGDLSGIVTQLIRWPLTSVYLPGKKVALMSDWTEKIEAMARGAVDADVRGISGMPSWTTVLFERVLQLARESGRKADCIRDVWPNFDLFIHGGTRYAPFDAKMRTLWSGSANGRDIPNRVEVYAASEAFVAVQDEPDEPSMRLNIDSGVVYEFVPLEEIGADRPSAFLCDRVEKGQRYVVVLSTCAGLWRYVLGDVVEFDSIPPDGPARVRIVGRHKHFINAFGENLIVEHIETAVSAAAKAVGARTGEFTAAPVYPDPSAGRRAGLELAIEWEPSDASVDAFAREFDAALKSQNVDYTTKRKDDLGMAPPTVTVLPPGAFHEWMARKGKLGGQHKCPRCANHREIIDAVREAAGAAVGSAS